MQITYYIDTDQIKPDNQNITYFDSKIDSNNWVTLFSKKFDLPEDEVTEFLNNILNNDNLLEFVVMRDNYTLQATACFIRGEKENEALLTAIFANEGYLSKLLSKLKVVAEKYGYNRLLVTFTHLDEDSPLIDTYVETGFKKLA